MSNSDFTNGKYQNPDFLSTDALREILRLDLDVQDEDADPEYQDYIFRVMEVLELREPASDASSTQSTEEAWIRFLAENPSFPPNCSIVEQNYTDTVKTQKKKNYTRRFSFSRILIASVLTAILFASVTASAFNLNVFEIIGRWTEEIFHLGESQENRAKKSTHEESLTTCETLIEYLQKFGVTEPLVPKWIPSGFYSTETSNNILPDRTVFFSSLGNKQGKNIAITITQYSILPDNLLTDYEKNNSSVERYEKSGIIHYILFNYDKTVISWLNNNIEVSITGDITTNESHKMIDSIYKEN